MNNRPWPYRPSHFGDEGEGDYYWIRYEKPHTYRGGATHIREYSKKVYITGKNPDFDKEPKIRENRQGNKVYGITVTYTNDTEYGERKVTKVIPLPEGAENVDVTDEPPGGKTDGFV